MNVLGNCHNESALKHTTTNGNHPERCHCYCPCWALASWLWCVFEVFSLLVSIAYKLAIPNMSFSWKSHWYLRSLEHGSPITGACNKVARANRDPCWPNWYIRMAALAAWLWQLFTPLRGPESLIQVSSFTRSGLAQNFAHIGNTCSYWAAFLLATKITSCLWCYLWY